MRVVTISVGIVASYFCWVLLLFRERRDAIRLRDIGVYDPKVLRFGLCALLTGGRGELRRPAVVLSLVHAALVAAFLGFVLWSLLTAWILALLPDR